MSDCSKNHRGLTSLSEARSQKGQLTIVTIQKKSRRICGSSSGFWLLLASGLLASSIPHQERHLPRKHEHRQRDDPITSHGTAVAFKNDA